MAVFTPLPEDVAARICQDYDLGPLRGLEGIPAGSVNTNYRLETERGTWFVRIDERRSAGDLDYEAALIDHITDRGFPAARPLTDSDGARQRTFAGKQLMVFPFLDGRVKHARDYRASDLAACGELLGRLHEITQDFERTQANRFSFEQTQAMWAQSRADASARDAEAAALVDRQLQELPDALAAANTVRVTIHGDLFDDNVLFAGGAVSGILDFEAACTDAAAFDLAVAVNALAWPDGIATPTLERVEALLRGYQSVRALPDADSLTVYLRSTATRFLVTRIRDFVLTPPPAGGRVDKDYRDYVHRLRWWSKNRPM